VSREAWSARFLVVPQEVTPVQVPRSNAAARPVPAPVRGPVGFRPELQGLRAIAVVLVVVYHVWLDRVSGGVDVFFLLTGFLLTGQLVRAAERGALDLRRRWSRMVVRLVPCAALVLVATAVASVLLLPEERWPQTLRELVAAVLFLENWQLAADSVDYAAQNNMASVVQQFWSLSIQGQFFLIWPLLVVVLARTAGRTGRLSQHLTAAATVLFGASLLFSVELTASNQPLAYFHTLTRLWEFALGGLLALHVDRIRLPLGRRLLLGWVGVVGLVLCGLVLPVGAVFPGVAALWPTTCAALVLVAGTTGDRRGVDRWLAHPGVQYVGSLSFTLYLWHWPVLVLYLVGREREEVGLVGGAGVIGLSLLLAVVTHHLVERRLLRRRPDVRAGFRHGAVGVAAVLLVVLTWNGEVLRRATALGSLGDAAHPGAVALVTGPPEAAPVLPPPVNVYEDWVRIEHWDCAPLARFPMDACVQPVEGEPLRRVVVVGDSHIQQFSGALVPIAERRGWQLTAMVRGACPFSTASETVPGEPDCLAWNEAVAAEIIDLRPDAVVTMASRDVRVGLTEQTPPGFVEQWRRLSDLGIPVLAVRDNPRFDAVMPDCVLRSREAAAEDGSSAPDGAPCGAPRAELYAEPPPWTAFPDLPPTVTFLDIADAVCDPGFCPAEIGNVLVYMDDNHLTASYATSMAPLVEDQVVAALEGAPVAPSEHLEASEHPATDQ
jgi:peptidoglycan/LPS O-acetylase OafA/YrhL